MTGGVPVLRLVVPGEPYAKQRPKARSIGKGRVTIYTPPETKAAELVIANAWRAEHPGYVPVQDARYGVAIHLHRAYRYRRDLDNLAKLVLDALNGLAYADDYQVEHLRVDTSWTTKDAARTEVAVWTLGAVPTLLGVEPATLDG